MFFLSGLEKTFIQRLVRDFSLTLREIFVQEDQKEISLATGEKTQGKFMPYFFSCPDRKSLNIFLHVFFLHSGEKILDDLLLYLFLSGQEKKRRATLSAWFFSLEIRNILS